MLSIQDVSKTLQLKSISIKQEEKDLNGYLSKEDIPSLYITKT